MVPELPKAPHARPLSAAVRLGVQLHPITPTTTPRVGGRQGRSALLAAWLAQFDGPLKPGDDRGFTTARLVALFPELTDDSGKRIGTGCPHGPMSSCPHPDVGLSLEQKIIHLEDRHGRTREQVADWLQAHGY